MSMFDFMKMFGKPTGGAGALDIIGGNSKSGGIFGNLLGGGLGTLVKGGGLVGALVLLFKMLTDIAKSKCTDQEWADIVGPFSRSVPRLFQSFGMDTPGFITTSLDQLQDRESASRLEDSDHKHIAKQISSSIPKGAESRLAGLAEERTLSGNFLLERLKSQPVSSDTKDRFGFDSTERFPDLSLSAVDQVTTVNRSGVAALKSVSLEKPSIQPQTRSL